MGQKGKVLHILKAKGKNKRIDIVLYDFEEKGKMFRVVTKTLVDFKKREILSTDNGYSIETFAVLKDLFECFLENAEVKNKLLLKELADIQKFSAYSTFK